MLNFIIGTAILQCLLFSLFLLTNNRNKKYSNKYFAFLLIALSTGFIDHLLQANVSAIEYPSLFFIFNFSGLLIAPLIYLYSRSVLESPYRYKNKDLLLFTPFVLFAIFIISQYHILSIDEKIQFISSLATNNDYMIVIPILGYSCMLLYIFKTVTLLKMHFKNNKKTVNKADKQNLKVLSFVIYGYLGIFSFAVIEIYIAKVLHNEDLYFFYNWIDVIYWFLFSTLVIYHGLTYPSAFEMPLKSQKYQNSPLQEQAKLEYKKAILDCIENDKPYFNSQLTLNEFSNLCKTQPKYLSQILNEYFEMSFFDFINAYRIEFVKQQFQNNSNNTIRIIDVAYDSGFNSKAAFNRAFKKKEGCTPTEYLKSIQ